MSSRPAVPSEEDSDDFDDEECSFSDLYTNVGQHILDMKEKCREEVLKKLNAVAPVCDQDSFDLDTSSPPTKVTKSSTIKHGDCEVTSLSSEDSSNTNRTDLIEPTPHVGVPVGRITRSQVTVPKGRGRGRGRAARRGRHSRNVYADEDSDPDSQVMDLSLANKSRHTNFPTPKLLPRPRLLMDLPIDVSDDSDPDISLVVEEDPNWEMSVKVCWKYRDVHKFSIRKFQKLTTIFEYFSKLENVPEDQIRLLLHDNVIQPTDTPDSLQLSIANIIEGGVVIRKPAEPILGARSQIPVDTDSIQLKVCTKDSKEPIMVKIRKTEKMVVLMSKISEELQLPLKRLKFLFDGETLNQNETPGDLDLEGGELIDLRIIPN